MFLAVFWALFVFWLFQGPFWPFWGLFCFWPFWGRFSAVSRHFLAVFGRFRLWPFGGRFLAVSRRFGLFLGRLCFCRFGAVSSHLLAASSRFWSFLAVLAVFLQYLSLAILAVLGPFVFLTVFESFFRAVSGAVFGRFMQPFFGLFCRF